MQIESVGSMGVGTQMPVQQGTDATSRNIQNQIQMKQQELQKLSENDEMSLEEKMKKRQEIQKEIFELNNQLRQHQIEQRRQQQQSKDTSMDDMLGGKREDASPGEGQAAGFSQTGMKAMISADASMEQAQVQGSVAARMEGKAKVLKSEIEQDKNSGTSTEHKEAEMADLLGKAQNATVAQMGTLRDAVAIMEAAKEEEKGTDTADGTQEASGQKDGSGQTEAEGATTVGQKPTVSENMPEVPNQAAKVQKESGTTSLPESYTPVDILL